MTDIDIKLTAIQQQLHTIATQQQTLFNKLERVENQLVYCVDALIDLEAAADEEPLSQRDMEEFESYLDDDNDDNARVLGGKLEPQFSNSSSSTKQV